MGNGRVNALCGALVALAMGMATPAQASHFTLTQGFPDITSVDLLVSYNTSTGDFIVNGDALSYAPDGNPLNTVSPLFGSFSLSATFNAAETLLAGVNAVTITGNLGSGLQNLLVGTITDVAFTPPPTGAGTFYFKVLVNQAQSLAAFGPEAGIILSNVALMQNFQQQNMWQNNLDTIPNLARSDAFSTIPEPATLALVGFGLLGAVRARRRRS